MSAQQTSGRLPYHRSITGGHLSKGGALRGIASEDGINVAWVSLSVLGADDRLAFIVKACNAHGALVEALRAARTYMTDVAPRRTDEARGTLEIIDAALA